MAENTKYSQGDSDYEVLRKILTGLTQGSFTFGGASGPVNTKFAQGDQESDILRKILTGLAQGSFTHA